MSTFWWVRAYWASIVWTIAGIASMFIMPPLSAESGHLTPLTMVLALVPLGFLGFAFLSAAWVSFRCWQAAQGRGPICIACAGPLGQERPGKFKNGPYRTCMCCGTHVNHRHYA